MTLESLNLDPETERLVREGGWEGSLAPFMIIYGDGMVESIENEHHLCESIKYDLNHGHMEDIAYVFCDGIQADYEYIEHEGSVIEVALTPCDLNDEIEQDDMILDAEMDREMERAMDMDMDCTVGRGYANC